MRRIMLDAARGGTVLRYDFYLLDGTGFFDRGIEARLADDAAALAHAAGLDHPHAVEVVQAKRVIGKVWPRQGTRALARAR